MLRSELVLNIQKKYPSLNVNDIEKIIELFFKKVFQGLLEGKKIEIRGFGTFSKKINKEKYVRNPRTNEKIFKKQTNKIHFKVGKILHNKINSDNSINE